MKPDKKRYLQFEGLPNKMKDFSYITNSSPAFIEGLYQEFVKDPNSVDPEFKRFFEGFDFALSFAKPGTNGNGVASATASQNGTAATAPADTDWKREIAVYRLILGYRNKG